MDVGSDDSGSSERDRFMREQIGLKTRESSAPTNTTTHDFDPDRHQMATAAPHEQGNGGVRPMA
jgi:hypothetical protein